jgi:hypothetical protein
MNTSLHIHILQKTPAESHHPTKMKNCASTLMESKRPHHQEDPEEAASKRRRVEAEEPEGSDSYNSAGDESQDQNNTSEQPEEKIYEGDLDEEGLYTGYGTLTILPDNVRYEGHWEKGLRCGQGTLRFPDGSSLSGTFQLDSLWGPGVYVDGSSGIRIEGEYEDGELNGPGIEYEDDQIFFQGNYEDGLRHGPGVLKFKEGSRIEGIWVNGHVEGDAVYYYPDGSTLRGKWRNGRMRSAKFTSVIDPEYNTDEKFCYDASTKRRIARYPLRQDPYERQYTYVKPSIIPGAGEGLFVNRDLPAGFIVAMYGGIRISLEQGEAIPWDQRPNLICLDDDMCVDVPLSHSDLSIYRATTGHKANHHWDYNAEYQMYFNHPIFGKIRCIQTIVPIKKDEEVFVDYCYQKTDCPTWYQSFMEGHWKDQPANPSSPTITPK